jgi:hypothetical protein
MIRQHVVFSDLMIKGVPHLAAVLDAGRQPPRALGRQGLPAASRAGEEIPLLGRIMALADALAAMTHDRPYRRDSRSTRPWPRSAPARARSSTPT